MKALTIGGAMVDAIAIIDDDLIERISMTNAAKTFLLLEQGSKTETASISSHCGGGAINAAISLVRQGFEVAVVSKLGQDERASAIRETLLSNRIETAALASTTELSSGASIIISAHDRNAAVFTFRGANTRLEAADLKAVSFDVDLVYVSTLSGESADILPAVVNKASQYKATITVNPGLRQINSRFAALYKLLPDISILAMNRLEAEYFVRQAVSELSGSENATLRRIAATSLDSRGDTRVSRHDTASALISGLRQLGANTVLLTDGKHGAYVGSADGLLFCPALAVEVVSSVGAGDAFVSTYAGTIVRSGCSETAIATATLNAASVVTVADSHSGLLGSVDLKTRDLGLNLKKTIKRWKIA